MKIFMRISAFVLSLILGVQFAALASWAGTNFTIPAYVSEKAVADLDAITATPPFGLYITYAGMIPATGEEGPYLRFIAYNGTADTLNYTGFGSEMPFPRILLNGLDANRWICRNGSTHHSIEPWQTAEFKLPVWEFDLVPQRGQPITVGFHLQPKYLPESNLTNSQPFVLPNEFRAAIRRHQQRMISSQ